MLKHVLVTLDGSELAEVALTYARKLVGPGSQITLLSVLDEINIQAYTIYGVPAMVHAQEQEQYTTNLQRGAREYLDQAADKLRRDGIQVTTQVEVGDPPQVIVDTARKHKVDAIVMSTHGRSGISRWLFGSVTQKVLGAMPCPVFVIPGRKQAEQTEG